jgi:hypothetical protein
MHFSTILNKYESRAFCKKNKIKFKEPSKETHTLSADNWEIAG